MARHLSAGGGEVKESAFDREAAGVPVGEGLRNLWQLWALHALLRQHAPIGVASPDVREGGNSSRSAPSLPDDNALWNASIARGRPTDTWDRNLARANALWHYAHRAGGRSGKASLKKAAVAQW